MSEESDQERTEQPSEKRLREAREKGDLPRSRDLSGALVVLAGVSALLAGGDKAFMHAKRIYSLGLEYPREALFSDELPARVMHAAMREAMALFAPVAIATMLATLAGPILLGGLSFSGQALQPKFDRLDPLKGLGRIFALRGLVELAKSFLKLFLIGGVLAMLLWQAQAHLLATGRGPVPAGIAQSLALLGRAALLFGSVLALIGGIDALYQRFDYGKRQRMTKQEVRDEMKESEGNPELKNRIRQVQHQLARRRMMQELPQADVVVVNPTHFAVACVRRGSSPRVSTCWRSRFAWSLLATVFPWSKRRRWRVPCMPPPNWARKSPPHCMWRWHRCWPMCSSSNRRWRRARNRPARHRRRSIPACLAPIAMLRGNNPWLP